MPAARERAFAFLRTNARPPKPRSRGVTEIRGPYYTPLGRHALEDVLSTMGAWVDALKYAGGFLEHVLSRGVEAVERYLGECKDLGFDIVEVSSGFLSIPAADLVRLTERVRKAGLAAKPEVGIQFGAGGASAAAALAAEGTRDVAAAIALAKRHLDAGAVMIMIESEGITESVAAGRTDVVGAIAAQVGLEHVMFEAADPDVFAWYVKSYGPDVNLFVDHSQIVQLECLRAGIWGTSSLWGRVVTYRP